MTTVWLIGGISLVCVGMNAASAVIFWRSRRWMRVGGVAATLYAIGAVWSIVTSFFLLNANNFSLSEEVSFGVTLAFFTAASSIALTALGKNLGGRGL